jgi:hypothetical protein
MFSLLLSVDRPFESPSPRPCDPGNIANDELRDDDERLRHSSGTRAQLAPVLREREAHDAADFQARERLEELVGDG